MRSFPRTFGLTVTFLFVTLPVTAHHSGAMYDNERNITLNGTVKTFRWANPHVYIEIETTNGAGDSVDWYIEALPPAGMRAGGWTRQSLVPGDQVIISASPAKNNDRRIALGHAVIKTDGTRLAIPSLRRGGPPSVDLAVPIAANSLSGRWVTRWNPEVASQFFQPLTSWSLTDNGIAAVDRYKSTMDPGSKCIPEPVPYVMIFPAGKSLEIGDVLTTFRDELGTERKIHMNVDTHDGAQFSIHGHSIGWWEDSVLVVDTTHFVDHRRGLAFPGLASGQQKHLIERLELGADNTTMRYSYWLEDPEYLAEPVSGKLELVYRPDRPFITDPCDLESASRYLVE